MLYLPPGSGMPIRVHGAYASDEEVHRVAEFLKSQGEPNYLEEILSGATEGEGLDGESTNEEADALYDQAVAHVLRTKKASISAVQREFRIGYNRSARLLEQMERSGVVSAMQSNGSREIIAPNNHS